MRMWVHREAESETEATLEDDDATGDDDSDGHTDSESEVVDRRLDDADDEIYQARIDALYDASPQRQHSLHHIRSV